MGSRVGVIGAGYVGLTSAACLAHLGHHVTCLDNDESKVDKLARGAVPIAEPGLPELVREGLAEDRLGFTTEPGALADSDVVLLCLPTPMGPGGTADLGVLEEVLAGLSALLTPGCVVVTKSTVPVGTAARIPELLGRGRREAILRTATSSRNSWRRIDALRTLVFMGGDDRWLCLERALIDGGRGGSITRSRF